MTFYNWGCPILRAGSSREGWESTNLEGRFGVTEMFWQLISSAERCPLRFDLDDADLTGCIVAEAAPWARRYRIPTANLPEDPLIAIRLR